MRRRPLCFVAVGLILIQVLLMQGRLIGYDRAFSFLEEDRTYVAEVIGTVYKKEEQKNNQVVYLRDSQIILKNKFINHSKVQVRIEPKNSIKIGNQISCKGIAMGFQSSRNPGNFDVKKYYATRGIYVQLKAKNIKILDGNISFIGESLFQVRKAWKQLLFQQMGERYGSVMAAMLLGEKGELDADLSKLYKQVGIGHILAISGLHMSFIGFGLYKILRKMGNSFKVAGTISFFMLVFYTLLTGCGVSSVRALLMFLIRMGAEITGRDYDMATAMGITAFGMCLWNPLYLRDEGFLLSYVALVGIAVVAPSMLSYFQPKNKMIKAFISGFAIQGTLLPVLLSFYFEYSLYAGFLNMLVLPGMSLVLGTGIFGSLVAIFWEGGANLFFGICKGMLFWYEWLGRCVRALPKSIVITGKPMLIGICIYYGILSLFCCVVLKSRENKLKLKKGRITGMVMLSLFSVLIISCILPQRENGKLIVTMLDVGQGDGIYIKTPDGQTLFVDGGSSNVTNVGEQRIGTFLKSKGVKVLDYVLISHGDADHKNGIEELLMDQSYGIQIHRLLLPPEKTWDESLEKLALLAKDKGTSVQEFEEGQMLKEGQFSIECLAPGNTYGGKSGNEASMVFELHYQNFQMLFTGDLEGTGEKELLQSGKLRQCTVLKVAHHGSKNSTSEKFMEEVRPSVALISSGINNRYGHPDDETIHRLEKYGCRVFQTQKKGAITLKTDGNQIQFYENLE